MACKGPCFCGIAKGFCENLKDGIDGNNMNYVVAKALHDSVLKVRARGWKQPLSCAQYIHMGA